MKKLIIIAGLMIVGLTAVHVCLPDGLHGTFSALAHGHDTRYAPDYSYWDFMRVQSGMSSQEVVSVLGEPLHRFSVSDKSSDVGHTVTAWQYSLNRDPINGYFKMRLLLFEDDRVTEKASSFCPPFYNQHEP